MKNVNVGLVRLIQFVVFVLFTFMVLTYFGALLLLPLDAVALFIKVMTAFGLNGVIAAAVAVPLIAYLGLSVYKIPGLCKMLVEIGIDLATSGKSRVEQLGKIAETVKG